MSGTKLARHFNPDVQPLQHMLAEVADDVDLKDLLKHWAEDYPEQFLRVMIAIMPASTESIEMQQNKVVKLQMHPALQRGGLDESV